MKKAYGIIGWSGSGKTNLTCRIISHFTKKKIKVASIKHSHHNFQVDKEGKDSFKHAKAGSNEVIIYNFETDQYSSYLRDSLVNNDVKTITQGTSQILTNGDLFIEETDYGRSLYFNSDGSLRWSHLNRAENGNVYYVGWSRILYTQEDIQSVINFLDDMDACNE